LRRVRVDPIAPPHNLCPLYKIVPSDRIGAIRYGADDGELMPMDIVALAPFRPIEMLT
jgi:hypothetical protein